MYRRNSRQRCVRYFIFAYLHILASLPPVFPLDLAESCICSGRSGSADLGEAENGLPEARGAVLFGSRKPKACGREGTLSPPIGDGSKMPFHDFRCCVSVELVTDIDETLNGGNIHVVDGGEVKDHSTQ